MIKAVSLFLGLAGLVIFMRSANFGSFLAGATSIFTQFNSAISGHITPTMYILILCVVVLVVLSVLSIFS